MGVFKLMIVLLFLSTQLEKINERILYFFPEYKSTFLPDSCTEEKIQIIGGYRYLKIRMLNNCKEIEVKCYNSNNRRLIEWGHYINTDSVITKKAFYRDVSTGEIEATTTKHYKLCRIGVWKFYDKSGKVIKLLNYE